MQVTDDNIDIKQLQRLCENDVMFMAQLAGLYVKNGEETVRQILDDAAKRNFVQIKLASHSLKGASLNVGAGKVVEATEMIINICENLISPDEKKDEEIFSALEFHLNVLCQSFGDAKGTLSSLFDIEK